MSTIEFSYNRRKSKRRESLSNTRRKSIVFVDDLPLNYKSKRKAESESTESRKRKSSLYKPSSSPPSSSTSSAPPPSSSAPPSSSTPRRSTRSSVSPPVHPAEIPAPSSSFPPPSSLPSSSASSSSASSSSASSSSASSSSASTSAHTHSSSATPSVSAPSISTTSNPASASSSSSSTTLPSSSSSSSSSSSTTHSSASRPIPTVSSTTTKPQSRKPRPAPIPASPIPESVHIDDDVTTITHIVKSALKEISPEDPLYLEYKKMGQVYINCAVARDFSSTEPTRREQLLAKEKHLTALVNTWSIEEQNWDLLLENHKKQQDALTKIAESNNKSRSKNAKKSKTEKSKKSDDEMLAQAQKFVVGLEKLKPHLSEIENYITQMQTKLTTVASDIQHSTFTANSSAPQDLIRDFASH